MSALPDHGFDRESDLRERLIHHLPPRYDPGPLARDRRRIRADAGLSMREFAKRVGFNNGISDVQWFEERLLDQEIARARDRQLDLKQLTALVDFYRELVEQLDARGIYKRRQKKRDRETPEERARRHDAEDEHSRAIVRASRSKLRNRRQLASTAAPATVKSPIELAPTTRSRTALAARWDPRPTSTSDALAPWPANGGDPLAPYIPPPDALLLAIVDPNRYRGESDPACYAFGGVRRTASGVEVYGYPCGKTATCRRCAIQFAATTLGRVYALWLDRGVSMVSVYRLPEAKWPTAHKALQRGRRDGRGGEYLTLPRHDSGTVMLFTDGELPRTFERYRVIDDGPVPVAVALVAVRSALRQPMSTGGNGKGHRYSTSKGWTLPPLRRSITTLANYVRGERTEGNDRFEDVLERWARQRHGRDLHHLSRTSPEVADALAAELYERPDLWRVEE